MTERVMAAHRAHPFDLAPTESPSYLGKAVVRSRGTRTSQDFRAGSSTLGISLAATVSRMKTAVNPGDSRARR